jgi:hypothetical protein
MNLSFYLEAGVSDVITIAVGIGHATPLLVRLHPIN